MKTRLRPLWLLLCLGALVLSCKETAKNTEKAQGANEQETAYYTEAFRPQFHFSPEEKWMNDPNGLVYHKGIYHLFYQYYPEDIVWGPMHWGHATSTDLVHWQHKPIALYPDEHGLIFSGSAVVDVNNTSGFGSLENPPLVAIFTYHDMKGEQEGKNDYQTQGIAYSLDNGKTWTKHVGNPVIKNNGYKDFRDPKVFWNENTNKWTMLLVAGDHMQVWLSDNLKVWEQVSEFGRDKGAHGGVWECPDMFKLKVDGTAMEKWVLLISINPGAPNGGSGTQYFIGDFDGRTFTTEQDGARWLDLGRDNYAGVTFNDAPNGERIFIGWMSNWDYARDTPTEKWRSAMTLPRTLRLENMNGRYELFNYPISQVDMLMDGSTTGRSMEMAAGDTTQLALPSGNQTEIKFTVTRPNMQLILRNEKGEALNLSLDADGEMARLDRSQSGLVDFSERFVNGVQEMPMPHLPEGPIEVRMFLDNSSLEVFVNKGQYVMTNQIFPTQDYTVLEMVPKGTAPLSITEMTVRLVARIWD